MSLHIRFRVVVCAFCVCSDWGCGGSSIGAAAIGSRAASLVLLSLQVCLAAAPPEHGHRDDRRSRPDGARLKAVTGVWRRAGGCNDGSRDTGKCWSSACMVGSWRAVASSENGSELVAEGLATRLPAGPPVQCSVVHSDPPSLRLRGGARTGAHDLRGEEATASRGGEPMRTRAGRVQKPQAGRQSSPRLGPDEGGVRVTGVGPGTATCINPGAAVCSNQGKPAPKPRVWELELRVSDDSDDALSDDALSACREEAFSAQHGADHDGKSCGRHIRQSAACAGQDIGAGASREQSGEARGSSDGGVGDEREGRTHESAAGGGAWGDDGDDGAKTWHDHRWPLDLNGVLLLYHQMNETLMLQAGEYQLSSLVRIEETARIGYAPPQDASTSRFVNETIRKAVAEAVATAKTETVHMQDGDGGQAGSTILRRRMAASEGIVVRVWGAWSMGEFRVSTCGRRCAC